MTSTDWTEGDDKIVLPPVNDDQISNDLVALTETLMRNGLGDPEYVGGMLGGEFGYGTPFENGTFMLHPFCWCERDDCDWCLGCTCPESAWRYYLADGSETDAETYFGAGGYSTGRADHTPECDYCTGKRKRAPNFLHKPTGTRVEWYKYIGRGSEVEMHGDWRAIFADCIASLSRGADEVPG